MKSFMQLQKSTGRLIKRSFISSISPFLSTVSSVEYLYVTVSILWGCQKYIHIFFSLTEADLKVNVKAAGREVDALHAETPAEHTLTYRGCQCVWQQFSWGLMGRWWGGDWRGVLGVQVFLQGAGSVCSLTGSLKTKKLRTISMHTDIHTYNVYVLCRHTQPHGWKYNTVCFQIANLKKTVEFS